MLAAYSIQLHRDQVLYFAVLFARSFAILVFKSCLFANEWACACRRTYLLLEWPLNLVFLSLIALHAATEVSFVSVLRSIRD